MGEAEGEGEGRGRGVTVRAMTYAYYWIDEASKEHIPSILSLVLMASPFRVL